MSLRRRTRQTRALAAVALTALTLTTLVAGNAAAQSERTGAPVLRSSGVSARPDPGGSGRNLHATGRPCPGRPGDRLITATGFAAGQPVLVRQYHQPRRHQLVRADRRGTVTVRATEHGAGDVVTFVGQLRRRPATGPGTVAVSVPPIAVFHF